MPRAPRAPLAPADPVAAARHALLEGVGAEIAASFPGITRLGGQVVAALYLAEGPRSMDALVGELGRSKSNVFGNLRALEAAGIVERRREAGARHDAWALRGAYPDVIVGAYLSRLRRVVADKRALVDRARSLLGEAPGDEADALRRRLDDLGRKYALFAEVFARLLPAVDQPIDLERFLRRIPATVLTSVAGVVRRAMGLAR